MVVLKSQPFTHGQTPAREGVLGSKIVLEGAAGLQLRAG